MKVAYVVARYGDTVIGGAEHATRMLAERLVALRHDDVQVFTTGAVDASTWADVLPTGTTVEHGVTVHRFRSRSGRHRDFDTLAEALSAYPELAGDDEARRFVEEQGPVCPDALDAALAWDPDVAVFYPYLFWPTVAGVSRAGRRSVLHPAAHDEPWLRLPVYRDVLRASGALVFQTTGERSLVEGLFDESRIPQLLLGLGVETPERRADLPDPTATRRALGLDDEPYLLTVGRLEAGKGTSMLADLFATYKARRPGPLKLVLAGPIIESAPGHPDIVTPGPVSEDVKWAALAGAVAVVQPSYFEAFSLALLEAWASGAAVVVNGACGATVEHCARSAGGLWFDGYGTFEAVVDRLLVDPELRRSLADRGRSYVERHFAWPTLIDRYGTFLERVASAGS